MRARYRTIAAFLFLAFCSVGGVWLVKSLLIFLATAFEKPISDNLLILLPLAPLLFMFTTIVPVIIPALLVKLLFFKVPALRTAIKWPFLWSLLFSAVTYGAIIGLPLLREHQQHVQTFPETRSAHYDFSKPVRISFGSYDKDLIGIKDNAVVWIERTKNSPPDNDNLVGLFLMTIDPLTGTGTTVKLLERGSLVPHDVAFAGSNVYWTTGRGLIAYDIKSGRKTSYGADVVSLYGAFANRLLVNKRAPLGKAAKPFWYDLDKKEFIPLADDIADQSGITLQDGFLCYATTGNQMKRYDLSSGESVSFDLGESQPDNYTPNATDCQKDHIVYRKNIHFQSGTPEDVLYGIYDVASARQVYEKQITPGSFWDSRARLKGDEFQYVNEKYGRVDEPYQITSLNLKTKTETPFKYFIEEDPHGNYGAYIEDNGLFVRTMRKEQ